MVIGFLVPVGVMPTSESGPLHGQNQVPVRHQTPPKCDVVGCREVPKYKLVMDWTWGACGLNHLKALESAGMVA
jgi:Ino eighty subunit 2